MRSTGGVVISDSDAAANRVEENASNGTVVGVTAKGGELHMQTRVTAVHHDGKRVTAIDVTDAHGAKRQITGDYFFSTMPVRDLLQGLTPPAPPEVQAVSDGLTYRDFITVGVLLNRLRLNGGAGDDRLFGLGGNDEIDGGAVVGPGNGAAEVAGGHAGRVGPVRDL